MIISQLELDPEFPSLLHFLMLVTTTKKRHSYVLVIVSVKVALHKRIC